MITSVSIGIPAFNEARNIKKLLKSLLKQNENDILIKEIIVISDGSTDNTVAKVLEIGDKRIRCISDSNRLGKSARMNQIFRIFTADVLILCDADVTIKNEDLVSNTVNSANLKINGLAGINATPMPSNTLVSYALEAGVILLKSVAKKWNNGNNYLSFKGCWLALDKKLAQKIIIPQKVVNNDAFLYFSAVKYGYTPVYLENCKIYYNSPKTLGDHIKQASRFQSSRDELSNYFDLNIAHDYKIPRMDLAFSLVSTIMKRPVATVVYLGVYILAKAKKQTNIQSLWSIARSTK